MMFHHPLPPQLRHLLHAWEGPNKSGRRAGKCGYLPSYVNTNNMHSLRQRTGEAWDGNLFIFVTISNLIFSTLFGTRRSIRIINNVVKLQRGVYIYGGINISICNVHYIHGNPYKYTSMPLPPHSPKPPSLSFPPSPPPPPKKIK